MWANIQKNFDSISRGEIRMKKTLSLVMVFVLTISLLLPQVFMMTSAASVPSISATTVDAKPGDTVDVKINIANICSQYI